MLEAFDLAGSRGARVVLEGVSLRVGPGDLLLVRGRNGSGKSSLLRLLAGLVAPTAGRIAWAGVPVADDPPGHRARLHLVTVASAMKPELTAAENLAFCRALLAAGESAGEGAAIEAALAALDAGALAGSPVGWLSTGQRRRVALARLSVAPRPLWLLDEPETGLDAVGCGQLVSLVERHREAGRIAVVASHHDGLWRASVQLDLDAAG